MFLCQMVGVESEPLALAHVSVLEGFNTVNGATREV